MGWGVTGQYVSAFKKWSLGTHLRLGIFVLGTDNVLGFFQKNGLPPQAVAGLVLPLGKAKRPADRDGDGIFDKNDACPTEAGLARLNGCPDTDGLANADDECPTAGGPRELGGCPDVAGLKDPDGCPLANRTDPTAPGLLRTFAEALTHGPALSDSLRQSVRAYLDEKRGRKLSLRFSGENEEQLLRLAGLFKDELAAQPGADRVDTALLVRPGQAAAVTASFQD